MIATKILSVKKVLNVKRRYLFSVGLELEGGQKTNCSLSASDLSSHANFVTAVLEATGAVFIDPRFDGENGAHLWRLEVACGLAVLENDQHEATP